MSKRATAPSLAPFPPPPDIEGEGANTHQPLVYGIERAELTPNTIKTIRKNAGKISPLELARALCWSFKRLSRIARAERIDLRYPPHDRADDAEPRGA